MNLFENFPGHGIAFSRLKLSTVTLQNHLQYSGLARNGGILPAPTAIWQCQGSFYKTTPQKKFRDPKVIHIGNYSYFPIQNRRDLECACLCSVCLCAVCF
jgi:hypothetical protein